MKKITFLIISLILLTMPVFAIENGNSTDDFGIVLSRNNAGFYGTTNIYNPLGDIVGKISSNIAKTAKVYDEQGNLIKTYKKSGNRITCYDNNENVLSVYLIDENHNTTQYTPKGEIVASYKYDPIKETLYCYTPTGYLTGTYITDLNGKTMKYDQYGNIVQQSYSKGRQAINVNEGVSGIINSIFDIDSWR